MPDRVNLDDVRHVARLARLALTDAQAHALVTDLNTILEHMDVLTSVDTKGAREYASAHAAAPLRADRGPAAPLAARPESFAPVMRDGFFVVPRIATHEDTEP